MEGFTEKVKSQTVWKELPGQGGAVCSVVECAWWSGNGGSGTVPPLLWLLSKLPVLFLFFTLL